MISFLASEAAFFATLIVTYVIFLGKDEVGPTPSEALSLPLVLCTTFLLLSSSVTIHFAERKLRAGDQASFRLLWTATIMLGVAFLLGTAYEWRELITRHHLTISRNLFGTTYYTLGRLSRPSCDRRRGRHAHHAGSRVGAPGDRPQPGRH